MSKIKVYLASPWFNPKQKGVMDKVRNLLLEMGFDVLAPFYDGIVLTKENDTPEMRKKVFKLDVGTVNECDLVAAVIDDFDPGTIFEMGYGRGRFDFMDTMGMDNPNPQIIAYSDVSGRRLNVMLQEAVWGFANGTAQLAIQLQKLKDGQKPVDFLSFEKGDFV